MTANDVMATLESLGTEQNRKTYARHGAQPPCFGVSFANLSKLHKQIKTDHALATDLWKTGNFDACNLATMIANPAAMSSKDLDLWTRHINSHSLGQMFARNIAAKAPDVIEMIEKWSKSGNDLIVETAYTTLAALALEDRDTPDTYYAGWLAKIEKSIQTSQNRTRAGMNSAVIGIGRRSPQLRKAALAAAARIGKVVVDHGDTACKTPDAAAYIKKGAARGKAAG